MFWRKQSHITISIADLGPCPCVQVRVGDGPWSYSRACGPKYSHIHSHWGLWPGVTPWSFTRACGPRCIHGIEYDHGTSQGQRPQWLHIWWVYHHGTSQGQMPQWLCTLMYLGQGDPVISSMGIAKSIRPIKWGQVPDQLCTWVFLGAGTLYGSSDHGKAQGERPQWLFNMVRSGPGNPLTMPGKLVTGALGHPMAIEWGLSS